MLKSMIARPLWPLKVLKHISHIFMSVYPYSCETTEVDIIDVLVYYWGIELILGQSRHRSVSDLLNF